MNEPDWEPPPLRERALSWAREQALKHRREQRSERIPLAFRLADHLLMTGVVPKVWADLSKHPETWDAYVIMWAARRGLGLERAAECLENAVCPRPTASPRGRRPAFHLKYWYIQQTYSFLTSPMMWGMSRKEAISVIAEGFAISQHTVLKAIKK